MEKNVKGTGPLDEDRLNTRKEYKGNNQESEATAPPASNADYEVLEKRMAEREDALRKEMMKMQEQLLAVTKNNNVDQNYNELVRAIQNVNGKANESWPAVILPVDDYDEVGKSFFSYQVMTVLTTDRRKNQVSFAPIKPIVFEYTVGFTRKEGQDTHIINMCTYTSHSKLEQKWIREHTLFSAGVICERFTADVSNTQRLKSQRAAQMWNTINNMPAPSIVSRCRDANIPVTEDIHSMRGLLVDYLVDEEIKRDRERTEKIVLAQGRESYLEKAHEKA